MLNTILTIDQNKFPIVFASQNHRPSLVESRFEDLAPDENAINSLIENVHDSFFRNDSLEEAISKEFDMRHKTKNRDGSYTHVGKRHEDGSFFVLDHKLPDEKRKNHRFELKRLTKEGVANGRSIGIDKDEKQAMKKALAGAVMLHEAEAPHYRPDLLMSMSNPIASNDFQDFSKDTFRAGNVSKTPTRLADMDNSLQGFPKEQKEDQARDSKEVSPRELRPDLSVDWHADIPEKLLDPDVDMDLQPEAEVFPIFNQYRNQAWIQSGPPSALVASEIMEPGTLIMEEGDKLRVPPYVNEERLNELSKDTLKNYVRRAVDDLATTSQVLGAEREKFPKMNAAARQVINRRKVGLNTAARKLAEDKVKRFQPLGDEVDSGLDEENLDEAFFDPNGKSLEVLLNTHSRNCAGASDHCRDVSRQIEDYVKSHHGKDARDNLRAYSAIYALSKRDPDTSMVGKLRNQDQASKFRDAFFKAAEDHLHAKKKADA